MEITQRVALTREAITILMDAPARRAEFIVQVIYIARMADRVDVVISDGFTWIKGRLKPSKKAEDLVGKLSNYDVVSILGKDFEKSQDGASFLLKNLKIETSKVKRQIGKPVYFPDYHYKKEYIDLDNGNQFEIDHFITVKEVKTMQLGRVKGSVLAKIVRIPSNVEKVMNILIEDQEDSMQCCFFGSLVDTYHSTLEQGKWYLFDSPILQLNQCKPNELELKIRGQSKIRLTTKQTPTVPKRQVSRSKSSSQKDRPSKQFTINTSFSRQDLVFIIARPLCEYIMKDGLGKYYDCVDRFAQKVEILLWSECDYLIEVNKTYRFDGLRIKSLSQKITLQSHKQRTKVAPSHIKILSRMEMMKCKSREKRRSELSLQKPRQLGKTETLSTLSQFVQKCEKYDTNILFAIVQGYLTSQAKPCSEFESTYLNEVKKKIFYFNCNTCSYNNCKANGEPMEINGVVVCFHCKSQNIRVMWNLKAILQDNRITLPCQINNEIVEKMLELNPLQGLLIFLQNPNQLLETIKKCISFRRGIFKIISKRKQAKVRYFNVCEHYAYNARAINEHIMKGLQRIEETYREEMKVGRRDMKDAGNWLTDAESYDNEGDH